MSDQSTTHLPVYRSTQTDAIPRITPISGYATAAFILALLGPSTLGFFSLIAVACAHYASYDTKEGYRGGHFLTVSALILGYFTIGVVIVLGLLVTFGVLRP